jgi:hypothetical protein
VPGPNPNSREFKVQRAIGLREVIVGMTEQEVVGAVGRPVDVKGYPTNRGRIEVWTYPQVPGGFRREVTLRNGVVVSLRRAALGEAAARLGRTMACGHCRRLSRT